MTILTRQTAGTAVAAKNAPLTNQELDNNFIELATGKLTAESDATAILQYMILGLDGLAGYWSASPEYLFEDSAGTIPATVGGVVGRWQDVSRLESIGPELIANGTFDDATGWTLSTTTITVTGGQLVFDTTTNSYASYTPSGLTAGSYLVTLDIVSRTRGTPYVNVGSAVVNIPTTTPGTKSFVVTTAATSNVFSVYGGIFGAGGDAVIDNVSLKRLDSKFAYQATTANKPYLRKTPQSNIHWLDSNTSTSALNVTLSDTVLGRRNLLTYTEDFSNAAWPRGRSSVTSNVEIAPDGTLTGDKLVEDTTATNTHYLQTTGAVAEVENTFQINVKAGERSIMIRFSGDSNKQITFDPTTGAFSGVGSGISGQTVEDNGTWKKIRFSVSPTSNLIQLFLHNGTTTAYTGDGTSGLYLWGAQIELGSAATDYQRIVSAPAYCTVARATAEGVTFTENAEITASYNIAPAFGFNADIAIFNRALTATEKALITRYMQRSVPVLGANLVTNGTFDTNTTGWETTNASIASVDGRIIATNTTNGGSGFQQNIATNINSHYFARMRLLAETSTGIIFFNANTHPANAIIASTLATTAVTGNTLCLKASTALTKLQVSASTGTLAGETYTCDNISVREIL